MDNQNLFTKMNKKKPTKNIRTPTQESLKTTPEVPNILYLYSDGHTPRLTNGRKNGR
jgi:hypothetical protein